MQDPQKLIQRFKSRVHVLDGGLATELEKRGHDISGKLWSAQVLLDDPGAIEQLHYDYLKAGADIIITSSYQLTFQGMKEAGYTHEQAEDAFHRSVEVAVKARERYLSELDEDPPEDRKPLIAASIGPYGAYLADGSEYTANYGSANSFEALQAFHRERMEFLAKTEADYFALETIPTIFEGISCLAIAGDLNELPVMLTFSCRDGTHLCSGHPMSHVSEVVNQGTFWFLVGVGMNCTAPRHIVSLLNEIAARETAPMVVYPNSGEDWD
ncbi:MAG: homocysteine S-methyltransferase, partial [Planctomycetes bacterium]|nr:homocysteine S-methyltransferase [Planctomycetota bacterium]